MDQLLTYLILGIVTGALYAVSASGLVLTYTTSGIFNFAHGAMGMFAAFVYWWLRFSQGWPTPVALIAVLCVLAPASGALIERVIVRGLRDVSEVVGLIVSVSLLFGIFQAANIFFPADKGRRFPGFFGDNAVNLHINSIPWQYNLTWHEIITISMAIVVALGLRFLLFNTLSGTAMRAVVDDRALSQLNGARPDRASMMSWALGAQLAALAGILLAGSQGSLAHIPLTLLVINAYGAAMFGRLKSLPLTFLGAMVLGLAQSLAIGYLKIDKPITSLFGWQLTPGLSLNGLRPAIPIIALFTVLFFLPPLKVRAVGLVKNREEIAAPPLSRWLIGTVVLMGLAATVGALVPGQRVFQLGQGLALGIVMLSLVPLTGYAGQISLAPMAFAGLGAMAMGSWGGNGNPLGLIGAACLAAAIGALVALPSLRLQGLYLALSTAAFAVLMDFLVFSQNQFLPNGNLGVPRVQILGVDFSSDRAHLVLLAGAFGLISCLLVAIRGSRFGRRLLAMKSSEAACVTLGVNLTATKLAVFTLSSAIAGIGGALYGAQLRSIGPNTFQFLQSLPVVLLAIVGGIGSPGGSLFGGVIYSLTFLVIPDVFSNVKAVRNLMIIAPAFAGISLGRNPNGAVNEVARRFREIRTKPEDRPDAQRDARQQDENLMGLEGFSKADLEFLDKSLGLTGDANYETLHRLSVVSKVSTK